MKVKPIANLQMNQEQTLQMKVQVKSKYFKNKYFRNNFDEINKSAEYCENLIDKYI